MRFCQTEPGMYGLLPSSHLCHPLCEKQPHLVNGHFLSPTHLFENICIEHFTNLILCPLSKLPEVPILSETIFKLSLHSGLYPHHP